MRPSPLSALHPTWLRTYTDSYACGQGPAMDRETVYLYILVRPLEFSQPRLGNWHWIFTRGQFWPSGIVIACVCVSVRVSVCVYQSLPCPHDNSSAVHARITKFRWETQNIFVKMPIILGGDRPWPSRSNLTWKSNFTSFWACPHDNFSLV